MPLPTDLFLAIRYLRPKRTFLSVISLMSVLGPLLGVAILIIVTSVMAGFDHDIKAGIMSMDAHLTIQPSGQGYFEDPLPVIARLEAAGAEYGLRATPVLECSALIQLRDSVYPKYIRGILPERESFVTSLQRNFEDNSSVLREGQAAIGARLGRALGLRPGDEFLVHSPARLTRSIKWREDGQVDISEPDEVYLPEKCRVLTWYSMGVSDYDDNIIVMHIDQAADLVGLEWGSATAIQAAVRDPMAIAGIARRLRQQFPDLGFTTWQEKNQLFFNTLQSEKNLMGFLMTFIVLVASFAIAATLITVAVKKTREIGIMKAVGISSGTIGRIFLFQGMMIGMLGTALGTGAGLLILHCRDAIARMLSAIMGVEVFPAELYHLTRIPALTTPGDLTRIIVTAMVICVLASLVPALYAAAFSPAESLRSEE